jgi:glycosyltransferase involved in cell wall biosynthesis
MSMPRGSQSWQYLVYFFLAVAVVLIGLQIWSAVSTSYLVSDAKQAVAAGQKEDLEREKARQELIGRRIENETKGLIQNLLATGFSALAAALVTIAGAILALRGYLDTREKERQDRLDTDRKEREDQFAKMLNDTITRLVSNEARQRVVGAAGLVPFFTPERRDFHLQALIALIAAARNPEELPEVKQGLRIAFEQAIRAVPNDVLIQVSWQGVKLPTINLAGRDLRGLDLRNAELENATLSDARLDEADLSAAKLQGAKLDGAWLTKANLTYADLAGASLARARLGGARLDDIQVLNLDLTKTDFTGIGPGWRGVPWDAARNWREAVFDADVRQELDAKFGPAVPPLRVLMLMWESPPLVAGGTWTACYHLVRNLRRRGAQVTVVVPWHHDIILKTPFGSEVPIVALGIVPPDDGGSPYGGATSSAYGHGQADRGYVSWSPYGGSGTRLWSGYGGSSGGAPSGSPYGGTSPLWSGYVGRGDGAPYSYGGPYGSYGIARPSLSGSILFRLIGEFRRRLEAYVRDHPADLIHAHDWVTFDAARAAASRIGVPWIAHFHSTEADRQPDGGDPLTERVEQGAVDSANRIVAPSATTKGRLVDLYRAAAARIDVVPNVLSEGAAPTADMGRFETKRVIFLGRLSRQKGVDRFCDVADTVRRAGISAGFEAFGDGDERKLLARHDIAWRGAVGWDKRGEAFRGASVMVVPSRAEPFGMVILEAMQYRVPVIYPIDSGAAEVLESGIKVRTDNTKAMADHVVRLLGSLPVWESTVRAQAREIEGYPGRVYEDRLMAVWQQSGARATAPT